MLGNLVNRVLPYDCLKEGMCGRIRPVGWHNNSLYHSRVKRETVMSQQESGERAIDRDGFRPNVGIVICNDDDRLLWVRRVKSQDSWQFPQGGIQQGETPEQAMYRELWEEVGLTSDAVRILGRTQDWLRYRLPKRYIRFSEKPICVGQKQIWFLLRLIGAESEINLDARGAPEFDCWKWVSYWYPVTAVVEFKQAVYRQALSKLCYWMQPTYKSVRGRR